VGGAAAALRRENLYIAELDPLRDEISSTSEIVMRAACKARASCL